MAEEEAREDRIADIAHSLNNLMMIILGQCEIDQAAGGSQTERVRRIKDAALKATSLIEDLSSLSLDPPRHPA